MDDIFSLKGKVIVVTGGTGVLGSAFADGIAAAGGVVGVLGRNERIANEKVAKIIANGGEAIALIADVTDVVQLENACQIMIAKYNKIDGLVNAAGGNIPKAILETNDDLFDIDFDAMNKVMQLNLFGTVLPTQIFGKAIHENGIGSIVNISSVVTSAAVSKVLGYSMAKAAVDAYTKWFAMEMASRFGDAIRMNTIAPGFFLTEQNKSLLIHDDGTPTARTRSILQNTPFKRFGEPKELVGALVWLLSDASKYVTGSRVVVDGGFTISSGV